MRPLLIIITLVALSTAKVARAQDQHDHQHGPTHEPRDIDPAEPHRHAHPAVDLAHPLVGESPLPETHLKLRYTFADSGDAREHTASAEVEYALVPQFSVEVALPYTFLDSDEGDWTDHFNDTEVSFKLATYRWSERGVLPAIGLGVGVPTGDEEKGIGSDHVWELEPFARIGAWHGRFEFIGGLGLGIPFNRKGDEREEEDLAVHYNLATLYHVAPSVQALVELHGESVFGDADDEHALYVSPGLTTQPLRDKSITIGAGLSLPLTDDREFDVAVNVLAIAHF